MPDLVFSVILHPVHSDYLRATITAQAERLQRMVRWRASNGVEIRSEYTPEYLQGRKILFLRGRFRDEDENPLFIPLADWPALIDALWEAEAATVLTWRVAIPDPATQHALGPDPFGISRHTRPKENALVEPLVTRDAPQPPADRHAALRAKVEALVTIPLATIRDRYGLFADSECLLERKAATYTTAWSRRLYALVTPVDVRPPILVWALHGSALRPTWHGAPFAAKVPAHHLPLLVDVLTREPLV